MMPTVPASRAGAIATTTKPAPLHPMIAPSPGLSANEFVFDGPQGPDMVWLAAILTGLADPLLVTNTNQLSPSVTALVRVSVNVPPVAMPATTLARSAATIV